MEHEVIVEIDGETIPHVTVDGTKFWLVSFSYQYYTDNERLGIQHMTATGYLDGDTTLLSLFVDYKTGQTILRK